LDSDDGMPMLTEESGDEDSDSSARNSSLSEFDSDEEFSYRKKGNRKKPVGQQQATNPPSSHSEPKTPAAAKQSRQKKPRAAKPRKPAPAASNLKVNTTHHPFITAAPLQVGMPVYSGFVGGFELPSGDESPEEELTLQRSATRRVATGQAALEVEQSILGTVQQVHRLDIQSPPSSTASRHSKTPARASPPVRSTPGSQSSQGNKQRGRPRKECSPVYESDHEYFTEEPDSDIDYHTADEEDSAAHSASLLPTNPEEAMEAFACAGLEAAERGEVPQNMDKYTFLPRRSGDSTVPQEQLPTFGWKRDLEKVGDKKGYGEARTKPSEMVQSHHSPFQVVFKAIGGEETIQTWVDETNYRAQRYFDSGRNMEEEETARDNDYPLATGDNARQQKLYGRVWTPILYAELMMWIALCLMMVIIGLSNESDYWGVTAYGLYPAFNFGKISGMSYKRWRQIKRFFNPLGYG